MIYFFVIFLSNFWLVMSVKPAAGSFSKSQHSAGIAHARDDRPDAISIDDMRHRADRNSNSLAPQARQNSKTGNLGRVGCTVTNPRSGKMSAGGGQETHSVANPALLRSGQPEWNKILLTPQLHPNPFHDTAWIQTTRGSTLALEG